MNEVWSAARPEPAEPPPGSGGTGWRSLGERVRRHFVAKAILTIAVSVTVVGMASILYFNRQYTQRRMEMFREELEITRRLIESSYHQPLWNVHLELIQTLNEAVLSAPAYAGIVIYDADESGRRGVFLATRKNVNRKRVVFAHEKEALAFAEGAVGRMDGVLTHQGQRVGMYELFYTTDYIAAQVRSNWLHLAGSFWVISLVTVLTLVLLLNHFFLRKILSIIKFARSVAAEGQEGRRIAVDSEDEIGELAGAINEMLARIEQRDREKDEVGRELRASRSYLQSVFDASPDGLFIQDAQTGIILDVNQSACRMFACTREDLIGGDVGRISHGEPPYDAAAARAWDAKAREAGPQVFTWRAKRQDGSEFWVEVLLSYSLIGGEERSIVLVRDVTDRLRVEEEREKLQGQLNQAQKIESVGRLAGGVAHDFNNMLGVILGFTELALEGTTDNPPLHTALLEIRKAAERSADLTRQLLAFARKQTIAPRVLDLNETVEGMLTMLRRLIGEEVELAWRPGPALPPVRIDPTQIDQILVNLCVNARDAITGAGEVSIETGWVRLDEAYCQQHMDCTPGDHVWLAVRDNGCGMDDETLAHLFEPFFTTKGVGEGTGLGLSTLYGIVRQNNGFIQVRSAPGQGTTFTVYLPKHVAERSGPTPFAAPEPATVESGHETILLVEDDPALLGMTRTMLERQGYTVLAAASPAEALRLAGERRGAIDLLMTDVIMPDMNGRDLARKLLGLQPGLRRLFMSGYTADVIAHHGVLNSGVHFIQKPFTLQELTAKVAEALERKRT